jgi:hypothetical protein
MNAMLKKGVVVVLMSLVGWGVTNAMAGQPSFTQVLQGTLDGQRGFIYNGGQTYAKPAFGDVDGDGDLDMYVGHWGALTFFRNDGTSHDPLWTFQGRNPLGISAGWTSPAFCDIDDDGDADLFVAGEYLNLLFYRSDRGVLTLVTDNFAPGAGGTRVPAFGDLDGDGDFDMFVTDFSNAISPIYFFENIGTPQMAEWSESHITSNWQGIQSGMRARLSFGDLDGDGDYDLLVSDIGKTPDVRYYENKGTRYAPSFPSHVTIVTPTYPGGGYLRCQPSFSDMDRDGDLDIVVVALGSAQASSAGWVNYFENKGTPQTYSFTASANVENAIPFILSENPVGTVADLNGDGYDDIPCGDVECGIMYFQQNRTGIHIAPGSITTTPGAAITFQAEGYTAPVAWTFAKNSSGASPLVPSGSTASYTAGAAVGTVDAIEVRDSTGKIGRAYVNVISPSQLSASGKAVVIAGRKADDPLWASTNNLAHYVFRTLLYRGFSKENVLYLNPQTGQDVDGNGNLSDDIDGASCLAAAQQALTTFAQGSPNLFVYLIDHGEADALGANGRFRLREAGVTRRPPAPLRRWARTQSTFTPRIFGAAWRTRSKPTSTRPSRTSGW